MSLRASILFSALVHSGALLFLIPGIYSPEPPLIPGIGFRVELVAPVQAGIRKEGEGAREMRPKQPRKGPSPEAEIPSVEEKKTAPGPVLLSPDLSPGSPEKAADRNPPEGGEGKGEGWQTLRVPAGDRWPAARQFFQLTTNVPISPLSLKNYLLHTNEQITRLIQDSIPLEVWPTLFKKNAGLEISYLEDGIFRSVSFDPGSDEDLAGILKQNIDWTSVRSPARSGLPHQTVKLRVGIDDAGRIKLRLDLL